MNRIVVGIALLACLCTSLLHAQDDIPPVVLDYFYEPGCAECLRIKREVLPELQERYEGFYQLNRHDMGMVSNVVRLGAYQQALSVTENSSVSRMARMA